MKVFLSVGRVSTQQQRQILERLEQKLRNAGLDPRTIGRNTFTSQQPLDEIKALMHECAGIIVLAFERTAVVSGQEARGLDKEPLEFGRRRYPTPWHQIELGMASVVGLPTLAIVEEGLHEEGLLEDKYGWYVYRTLMSPEAIENDEFTGILAHWTKRCQDKTPTSHSDTADLTLGQLIGGLKVSQLWAVLAALAGLVAGSFAVGKFFHEPAPANSASFSPSLGEKSPSTASIATTSEQALAEYTYDHNVGANKICVGRLIRFKDYWRELNPANQACSADTSDFQELGSDDQFYYIYDTNRNMTDRVPKQGGDVDWLKGKVLPGDAQGQNWQSVYRTIKTS